MARALAPEYCDRLVPVPFSRYSRHSLAYRAEALRNLASDLPFTVWRYTSGALGQVLRSEIATHEHDLLVCDFIFPYGSVPKQPGIPVVLFQHNVEARLLGRSARNARHLIARRYFALQAERMRRFELEACRAVDRVIAVSPEDALAFEQMYGVTDVGFVSTGVDIDFFRPMPGTVRRKEVIFLGALDWRPNTEGVLEFARESWPLIIRRHPDASLTVVGRNPSAQIWALAEAIPALRIEADVPDVRPFLQRGAAFVVPLRIGGGTRLKIFEAMAMEIPVVSTTVGMEGLPVIDGEHLSIRDRPEAIAEAVCSLLDDPAHAQRMAIRAAAFVRAECGWERVAEQFTALLPQRPLLAS
jgi:glycosyltransferase involved in cell wall biosynthesis